MYCPHCGKEADPADAHCRHCGGALIGSSTNALDALVEKKARAILAEQRAAEERAAEEERRRKENAEAAQRIAEEEAAAERKRREDETALESARAHREALARTPRPAAVFHPTMLPGALVFALLIGLPAGCIGECVSRRPMWGSTLCPSVCSDCRGPGVIQTWHSSGSGGDSDHIGAYCHNGHVDVETKEFWFAAVDGKAEDVELPWWKRNALTILLLTILLLLPIPFIAARRRRRILGEIESKVDDRIARLEASLGRRPHVDDRYR